LSWDNVDHDLQDDLYLRIEWEAADAQHLCAVGSNQIDHSPHAWVPRLLLIANGDTAEAVEAANATLRRWVFGWILMRRIPLIFG
jgi:hypothetical protein